MKVIEVNSWEEFEGHLSSFFQEMNSRKKRMPDLLTPLFRGQEDADWILQTTLDRTIDCEISIREYFERIRAVRPAVSSLTGKGWTLPEAFDPTYLLPAPPPGYEFMIYLRHHGFPSPLLDWSRSPYVAAYFAFHRRALNNKSHAAIYSFTENFREMRPPKNTHIIRLGPYAVSHRRHYSQQCEYTICRKLSKGSQEFWYAKHEDIATAPESKRVRLTKYLIPHSER